MMQIDYSALALDIIITWSIGLGVPFIVRNLNKKAFEKKSAIILTIVWWFIQFSFYSTVVGTQGSHTVLTLVSLFGYFILKREPRMRSRVSKNEVSSRLDIAAFKADEKKIPVEGFDANDDLAIRRRNIIENGDHKK
jgi:hypothetical protein